MKDHNRIKKPSGIMRMILMLMLSFTLITGMSISPSAWMTVNGAESVVTEANSEELQTDDAKLADAQTASDEDSVNAAGISETLGTADNKAEESARVSDADKDTSSVDGSADAEKDSDKATDAEKNETSEESEPAAGLLKAPAQQNVLLAAGDEGTQEAVEENSSNADLCNFDVSGTEGTDWTFDPDTGVLTILADVTVSMKEGKDTTSQRIVVAKDAKVVLGGVNIEASDGPAVKINAGVNATLTLAEGSKNTVTGSSNYAGIDVGYEDKNLATLTINGEGELEANGGNNSAGIGGSYNNKALIDGVEKQISSYAGNIIITGGTIIAKGGTNGAGIGSGGNNNCNWDGSHNSSASFKMQYHELGEITISGGTVKATAGGEGAGIGGGNHTDTGMITIKGDAVVTAKGSGSGAGIGNGCGSSTNKGGIGEKGPGDYIAYITIEGNPTVTAEGDRNGAGIGGGMYCDAIVSISGGNITAIGGHGDNGSFHHGGAGIGGGYVGHADITIEGGNISAKAGANSGAAGIGSGGTANTNPSRGRYTGRTAKDLILNQTTVTIEGSETVITATGGEYGGAGIGGGTGSDIISVSIAGGKEIIAVGGKSDEETKRGGAGIGSGLRGSKATTGKEDYYFTDTTVDVSITKCNVVAIGGWGASGIGSGADNTTAKTITIDVDNTDLQAYSDGTKFAIDTRHVKDDGTTESITEGRTLTGDILQGTFVHQYDQPSSEGVPIHQGTEGLKSIKIINDQTGEQKELTLMPDGYRSFATDVNGTGAYTVYSDDKEISSGSGRYFNKCVDDTRTEEEIRTDSDILERNVQYTVSENGLCDNFYLFPVKTVAIEKAVQGDTDSVN